MADINETYLRWVQEPTKENMSALMKEMDPLITSEISRYQGPPIQLKARGKSLAINAIKTYDPAANAKLTTWVVAQMRPLHRYSKKLSRPTQVSELANNQYAALATKRREYEMQYGEPPEKDKLADMLGISKKRIDLIESMMKPNINQSVVESPSGNGEDTGVATPGVIDKGLPPEIEEAVQTVYHSLNDRDRKIFELKTGHKGPVRENKEIAKTLGLSEGLISQVTKQQAEKIRELAYG